MKTVRISVAGTLWLAVCCPAATASEGTVTQENHSPMVPMEETKHGEATYLVDQGNPVSDDNNPGTEEQPWKTIQKAADMAKPGDVVYVMAGRYGERVHFATDGTPGHPIAVVATPRRSVTVGGFDLEASFIRERAERAEGQPVHCNI